MSGRNVRRGPSQPSLRHFDAGRARRYDERIGQAIPGYEALHDLALAAVGAATEGRGRVLIAGAGTGREALAVARAYPKIRVTAVEPAEAMAARAARKIAAAKLSRRIDLVAGAVADLPARPAFDAATLLLVLHFVPDDGRKDALLGDIARRLRPGGAFVLADMTAGWRADEARALDPAWIEMQRLNGIPAKDIAKGQAHVANDVFRLSADEMARRLKRAGFGAPTKFFQAYMFEGWIARKR